MLQRRLVEKIVVFLLVLPRRKLMYDSALLFSFYILLLGRNLFDCSHGIIMQEIQNFYCKNCEYHQHQCFACGKLGSSDKVIGAEV